MTTMQNRVSAPLLISIFAQGCAVNMGKPTEPKTTITTTNVVAAATENLITGTFLKWNEGLEIMLIDQLDEHDWLGTSTRGIYRGEGTAKSVDGKGYQWQLETNDGQTATFTIDKVRYELAKGGVFCIAHENNNLSVRQFAIDISTVEPNNESCRNEVKPTEGNFRSFLLQSDRQLRVIL